MGLPFRNIFVMGDSSTFSTELEFSSGDPIFSSSGITWVTTFTPFAVVVIEDAISHRNMSIGLAAETSKQKTHYIWGLTKPAFCFLFSLFFFVLRYISHIRLQLCRLLYYVLLSTLYCTNKQVWQGWKLTSSITQRRHTYRGCVSNPSKLTS